MTEWYERFLGAEGRLGLWTLPMFLVVGATGAVLAGTLSVVYYSQQVSSIRSDISETAARLDEAVAEVEQAREDAVAQVTEQLEAVREALARGGPIESGGAAGVVSIEARLAAAPAPAAARDRTAAPAALQPTPSESPTETETETEPEPEPEPPPPPAPPVTRTGSGFAVARQGASTFFATAYSLVQDPNSANGVAPTIEVRLRGTSVSGTVHNFDAALDIALIRADLGNATMTDWRPADQDVVTGEQVYAVGVTGSGLTTQFTTAVAAIDGRALVTGLVPPDFATGGPLVDLEGRVVGIVTREYSPFGGEAAGQVSVPIAVLCERLLSCGADGVPAR